jgi:hypothetical protein
MNSRRGRNHGFLEEMLLLNLQQARSFAKTHRIHWQDLGRSGEPLNPRANLLSFDTILSRRSFNSSLQFAKKSLPKGKKLLISQLWQPSQNTAVSFRPSAARRQRW